MKKIVLKKLIVATMFVACLCVNACGKSESGDEKKIEGTLDEIMTSITTDAGIEVQSMHTEVLKEAFSSFLFIDYIEGSEALAGDAMMSSVAHSIVLLRLPEGTDGSAVQKDIEAKIDPRKWICVEAEKTAVVLQGDLILVVMSESGIVDAVTANFNNLAK